MSRRPAFPEELLERYEIRRRLGAGAMGNVFLADDRKLGRQVAVKVLSLAPDPELRQRLAREARALAGLHSRHVVHLYDFDAETTPPFLVLEYLDGTDLEQAESPDVSRRMREAAEGLQNIHDAGLLHRDLKPSNIFVTRDPRAVLIDLGLTRQEEDETLTKTGLLVGTPIYMAPELFSLEPASTASDWYAWGAILFELLERRTLVSRDGMRALLAGQAPVPRFENVDADSPLARAATLCLAGDPDERPRHLDEVLELLDGSGRHRVPSSRSADRPAAVDADGGGPGGPSTRPRRHRRVARWLAPAALAGVGVVTALGVALSRRPGGADGIRPPPAASPPTATLPDLPRELVGRLEAELERVRLGAFDDHGLPQPHGSGRPFAEVGWEVGLKVFETLPAQREVFDWLAQGGRPERLGPEVRAAMQRYDDGFEAQDMTRPFYPFLAPLEPLGQIPEAVRALEIEDFPAPADARPRSPRHGTALAALAECLAAIEEAEDKVRSGAWRHEKGLFGLVATFNDDRRLLQNFALSRLSTMEGRRLLYTQLLEGRRAFRRFLWFAHRALEEDPEAPDWVPALYLGGVDECWPLLYPGWVNGHPDRLFGWPSRQPGGTLLRASVASKLLRNQVLLALEKRLSFEQVEALWRAVITAPEASPRLAALASLRALSALHSSEALARAIALWRSVAPEVAARLPPVELRRIEDRVESLEGKLQARKRKDRELEERLGVR